ncbi:MAG: beta-glucosidase [Myxococcales bacterium]|nr:beta-glucosidase [Myxococcales bacterium]
MGRRFPRQFVFGAATSSYQIEGAASEDGRGPSIWDTYCRTPGKVQNGDTGDVACDHYHRWPEDIALMKELSLSAYRFSLAWPRWFPTGTESAPVEAGVAFYDRLVDGLLQAGITPWVTLYHWDLPQALQDRGGWADRDTAHRFVAFADAVGQRLGDRVQHFITHNEPWCAGVLGHWLGRHAPGHRDPAEALAAVHHLLLSHGLAVPVLRQHAPAAEVGITLNLTPAYPASDSIGDALATERIDGHINRWFLDPVHGRGYPADQWAHYVEEGHLGKAEPTWLRPGDLDTMAAPIDFLGVNYYSRALGRGPEPGNHPRTIEPPPQSSKTDIGWEVAPQGLLDLLLRLQRDYGTPLVITENGAAYHTGPDEDGRVRDTARIAYYASHLDACALAIEQGVDLGGYFAWSLLDNFEWAEGYSQRFGLVYVDYATQRRVIKDSGRWYADLARTGALPETEVPG